MDSWRCLHHECVSCAGCEDAESLPQAGDVRLVPLEDTASMSRACDDVHFGGVEVFNRGRWGAVCASGDPQIVEVVCRQLEFDFGSAFDVGETVGGIYYDSEFGQYDTVPSEFGWANGVECKGGEARLDECRFTDSSDGTLAGIPTTGVLEECQAILGVACTRFEVAGVHHLQPLHTNIRQRGMLLVGPGPKGPRLVEVTHAARSCQVH